MCLVALLATAQPVTVLSNRKVADGWNPQFNADATELLYVADEADEVGMSADELRLGCHGFPFYVQT